MMIAKNAQEKQAAWQGQPQEKKTRRRKGWQLSVPSPTQPELPLAETKHQKFIRLGVARINRAITSMRLIGNLSGPGYEWTEEDIAALRITLSSALEATLSKFQPKKPPAPSLRLSSDQLEKIK